MLKHTLKKVSLLISIAFTATLCMAAGNDLPDMGSSAEQTLTPMQEQELGRQIMYDVRYQLRLVEDPYVTQYIQQLGDLLVSHSPDRGRQYTFFLVEDNNINAFALPGGYIGVNSGLLLQTRNESDLAAVLSHEISHVSQRHIARMFEKAKQMSLPSLAALVGSMAVAAASPQAGQAMMAATMAGQQQSAINFTRHNEEEADRLGIDILAQSGFNAQSMPQFFEQMDKANRYNQSGHIPEFLRTHPVTSNRVADAQYRANRYPTARPRDPLTYELIKERVRVFTVKSQILMPFYQANISIGPNMRYGYALSLAKALQTQEAYSQMNTLMRQNPNQVLYRMGLANIYAQRKDFTSALTLAEQTQALYPTNQAVMLNLSQLYLESNRPLEAKNLLKNYIKKHGAEPEMLSLLAQAYNDLNQLKAAYMAQADYYALQGNYKRAVGQLELARKTNPINDYETAMIDAKKQTFEYELKQQEKMEKWLRG